MPQTSKWSTLEEREKNMGSDYTNERRYNSLSSSNSGKSFYIRILAPSGDHFELSVIPTSRILDLKMEIFDSWPKGTTDFNI